VEAFIKSLTSAPLKNMADLPGSQIGVKFFSLMLGLVLISIIYPSLAGSSSNGAIVAQSRLLGDETPAAEAAKYVIELPSRREKAEPGGSITFIGTATVIIQYGGLTLLTDPNFLHKGDHVHLGYGLTSKRLTNPAIELEDLPPIDLIILSHMHGDHFDQLVQEKLDRNIPIVTTEESAEILKEMGFATRYSLKAWDSLILKKGGTSVRLTATPGRHGPPMIAGLLPDVMGSMLEFKMQDPKLDYRMYISGDTMISDEIREIPRRYPDVDMALLHLGGTKMLGIVTVTMDAKDGVRMMQIILPRRAIPIHYNDYDVFKSPLSDFEKEVDKAGLQDRVIYLKHGDMYRFPAK
jgi:L-ascorbate metabolism protein UlaG (beta-lactamase superfamily)